ncbi:MAG: IclR family transcriptional regulator [Betaproteobacteria bacterium]
MARSDSGTTKYTAPALDKGLDILEALANAPQGLTLNGLAKALGRTASEIFRMVVTLQQRGYLSADENDRYNLTLKMLELSHRQQPLKSLVATATPLMRELASRAYQSCHLSVYHDGHILVVAQVDAPGPFSMGAKVGALGKLSDSASGTILLAFRDEAERTRMMAAQIRIHGELEIDAAQLLRQIEQARSNESITWPSRRIVGATDVSRPVFGIKQEVIAALTVPYIERLDRPQSPSIPDVELLVREIAARLSERMYYTGHNELQ